MSRQLRIQFPGAIYHVTSRGNRRVAIVIDLLIEIDSLTGLA